MIDILDAILNNMISKLSGMPLSLRYFLKFLYEESKLKWPGMAEEKYYCILADFLIYKWVLFVCFFEPHYHGLTKQFNLGDTSQENLKLLSKMFHKIMKFESIDAFDEQYLKFQEFAAGKQ